jgi:uncharacterized protein YegP (UPF0339 family)
MVTATQQEPTSPQVKDASETATIAFVVFEDNAGDYRWSIRDSRGENLAQSGTFASYDAAHAAAAAVRDAAATGSSRLEPQPADRAPTRARDDSDAERWLDEGGSPNSEAVRQWPAER